MPKSTYKKLAVQWLNESLCFVLNSVMADSFRLRNRQLLVAANRSGEIAPLLCLRRICDFATSARRLTPPDVPPLRGLRTSCGFAKFPHASKLAEETSQSRRVVTGKLTKMTSTLKTEKGIIEYTTFGEGETILFIHGGHSNCNETLFQKGFETTKYQLLTPSRPGYGKTPLNFQNKSPKGAAELIISLLDKLKIKSAKVIGISAGGLTALELAANYPERISNLVLISALTKKWFINTDKTYKKGKKIFSSKLEKYSWTIYNILFRFFPGFMTKVMFKELSKYRPIEFDKDEIKELKEMTMKMRSFKGFDNDLDQDINQNILSKIKCETLILHSNYDNSVSFEHPENAKQNIKKSELITFNNRWGHLLWLGEECKEPLTEIKKRWET